MPGLTCEKTVQVSIKVKLKSVNEGESGLKAYPVNVKYCEIEIIKEEF